MPSDAQIKMGSRCNSKSKSLFNYKQCRTLRSAIGQLGATAFEAHVSVGNGGQVPNPASTARYPRNGAWEPAGQSGCLRTGGRRTSPAGGPEGALRGEKAPRPSRRSCRPFGHDNPPCRRHSPAQGTHNETACRTGRRQLGDAMAYRMHGRRLHGITRKLQ